MLTADLFDISPAAKKYARDQIAVHAAIPPHIYDMMSTMFCDGSDSGIMPVYNAFCERYLSWAKSISLLAPKGIGPGEMVIYFIFNNIGLGGGNAPIDLYMNGEEYAEVKSVKLVGNKMTNFKIGSDSCPSVSSLMRYLSHFNDAYTEIVGTPLEGWRGSSELKVRTLQSWRQLDLEQLAQNYGRAQSAIQLTVRSNGDVYRKGSSEPFTNVLYLECGRKMRELLSLNEPIAVNKELATIDMVIARWVDDLFDRGLGNKRFIFVLGNSESLSPEMRFMGYLTKDMVGLYCTHRNQPWAEVYLEPQSKETGTTL